jgi:hypothetical protein
MVKAIPPARYKGPPTSSRQKNDLDRRAFTIPAGP